MSHTDLHIIQETSVVVYIILISSIVITNFSIIIIILIKQRLRCRSGYFIIYLSISHITVGGVGLPVQLYSLYTFSHYTWTCTISKTLNSVNNLFCLVMVMMESVHLTQQYNTKLRHFYISINKTAFLSLLLASLYYTRFLICPVVSAVGDVCKTDCENYSMALLFLILDVFVATVACTYITLANSATLISRMQFMNEPDKGLLNFFILSSLTRFICVILAWSATVTRVNMNLRYEPFWYLLGDFILHVFGYIPSILDPIFVILTNNDTCVLCKRTLGLGLEKIIRGQPWYFNKLLENIGTERIVTPTLRIVNGTAIVSMEDSPESSLIENKCIIENNVKYSWSKGKRNSASPRVRPLMNNVCELPEEAQRNGNRTGKPILNNRIVLSALDIASSSEPSSSNAGSFSRSDSFSWEGRCTPIQYHSPSSDTDSAPSS